MAVLKKGPWHLGLVASMKDPELLVLSTDNAVVIKDKYPKARNHFLVLPKEDIPSIFQLTKEHLGLLDELYLLSINAIELIRGDVSSFKIGFHASPSMLRLHLHVISTDFVSPWLKTKLHWNSFNTDLFTPYERIYSQLQEFGSVKRIATSSAKLLEKIGLKCNQCDMCPKNMPELKVHLLMHLEQRSRDIKN